MYFQSFCKHFRCVSNFMIAVEVLKTGILYYLENRYAVLLQAQAPEIASSNFTAQKRWGRWEDWGWFVNFFRTDHLFCTLAMLL